MGREEARKEVDRLTREGLAEGYRLASDARNVIFSKYQDWMLIIAIFSMLLWVSLLFAFSGPLSGFINGGQYSVVPSSLIVAAVSIPLLFLNKRRFDALLAEQDRWLARLRYPPYHSTGESGSIFDLLVEVSQQVPAWLSVKQKDRYRGHPFLNTAESITAVAATYLTFAALTAHTATVLLIFWSMAIVFVVLTIALEWVIRKALRSEREKTLVRWKARMGASRQAMEEILGGL